MRKLRCKFVCRSTSKRQNYEPCHTGEFVYGAKFLLATERSKEDKASSEVSGQGCLEIETYEEGVFAVGAVYFVDVMVSDA